jgi:hypothetical protein
MLITNNVSPLLEFFLPSPLIQHLTDFSHVLCFCSILKAILFSGQPACSHYGGISVPFLSSKIGLLDLFSNGAERVVRSRSGVSASHLKKKYASPVGKGFADCATPACPKKPARPSGPVAAFGKMAKFPIGFCVSWSCELGGLQSAKSPRGREGYERDRSPLLVRQRSPAPSLGAEYGQLFFSHLFHNMVVTLRPAGRGFLASHLFGQHRAL